MRIERGQIGGDLLVYEKFELWGSVGGNVKVVKGGRFYHRGTIYGNLVVEDEGRCHIFGTISGDLEVQRGAKVIHSGIISGNAINNGGRLYIDDYATVMGHVKTVLGETKGHPQKVPPIYRRKAPPKK